MVEKTRFLPFGTMGQAEGDWDNDGDEDIIMGSGGPYMQQAEPALFYRNDGGGTFTNMTPFPMMSLWGKGHGVAFGDLGGAAMGDACASLFLRNKGNTNHWLEVALEGGPGTNRMAIGATVRVMAGTFKRTRVLQVGGRFSAVNTFRVHFGLAGNAKVDKLEVSWPNKAKTKTVIENVAADQAVLIKEADGSLKHLWGPGGKAAEGTR
jgi:hypothetical protein